jgi:hypothetical protein
LLLACSALKAVLDRVTAAAQQKDGQIVAAKREAAAAAAKRDAALARVAEAEAAAEHSRQLAATAELAHAAAAEAQARLAEAEQRALSLQEQAAVDARRWEEQTIAVHKELDAVRAELAEAQRGAAGAAATQAALQADVAELRR